MFLSGALLLAALTLLVAPPRRRPTLRPSQRAFPFASAALLVAIASLDLIVWSRMGAVGRAWGLGGSGGVFTWATYPLLHASLLHLAGNLVALWLTSPAAEAAVGPGRTVAVFFAASTAAGLVHLLLPATGGAGPLVGASGAVFGLLGLSAVRFWRARLRLGGLVEVPAAVLIAVALVLQAALAIARPGDVTSYAAHVGGALCGGLLALPLRLREAGAEAEIEESAASAERAGEWALAAAHYRELIRLRPNEPEPLYRLGLVSRSLGDLVGARVRLSDALRMTLQAQDYPAAARYFADCLDIGIAKSLTATELLAVAGACEAEGQPGLAEDALRQCGDGPERDAAQIRLARLYLYKLGRPEEAAALLRTLAQTGPESPWFDTARTMLAEADRTIGGNPSA